MTARPLQILSLASAALALVAAAPAAAQLGQGAQQPEDGAPVERTIRDARERLELERAIGEAAAALRRALSERAEPSEGSIAAGPAGASPAGSCEASVTLVQGDTLYGIARRCGTSVADILEANPELGDPSRVQIGAAVRLPAGAGERSVARAPVPGAPAGQPAQGSYTVRPGDTLYGIARRFGTTLDQVLALNPEIEDPALVRAGRQLNLPDPSSD